MDRGTLIRSYTAGDLGFILHSRHQYHWHTGYAPPQTVAAPHLGAIVSRTLGPRESRRAGVHQHRPAARRRRGRGAEGVHHGGFLGSEYGPFNVPYPGRSGRRGAPARRHDAGPLRESRPLLSPAARGEPDRPGRQRAISTSRCCARSTTRTGCSARPRPRPSTCRSSRWSTFRSTCPGYTPGQQFRADAGSLRRRRTSSRWSAASASAACWRGAWSKPARGTSR